VRANHSLERTVTGPAWACEALVVSIRFAVLLEATRFIREQELKRPMPSKDDRNPVSARSAA
jgi:hypothetical protein